MVVVVHIEKPNMVRGGREFYVLNTEKSRDWLAVTKLNDI